MSMNEKIFSKANNQRSENAALQQWDQPLFTKQVKTNKKIKKQ